MSYPTCLLILVSAPVSICSPVCLSVLLSVPICQPVILVSRCTLALKPLSVSVHISTVFTIETLTQFNNIATLTFHFICNILFVCGLLMKILCVYVLFTNSKSELLRYLFT